MKSIPVCRRCGSPKVKADAYAEWNPEIQTWELAQTFDKGAFCEECEGETRLKWKTLPPEQNTLFELKDDDRPVSSRNVAKLI